ncbi:hypothetical protein PG991_016204 [Apiospora marii]|uniref:Nephrocystin 3-like N-terminal domain-containing protein n=1 Tax=Apiospora marii TaxID=335849 RepID=A0ABR1R102_9PEZI
MARLSVAGAATEKEHAIIKTLNFEARTFRYGGIAEAHEKTFQWIFEDFSTINPEKKTSNYLEWLRHGDGIFWISGKPGAGKSTLMKFISQHKKTKEALSTWSHGKPVILASHFFWAAGTSMQKSRQGLLRTLLFDILRQQPGLIKQLCPERWEQSTEQIRLEDWGIPELSRILQRIGHLKSLEAKMCFFVDGLDEYEGDHVEFCETIQKLSSSPHVKVCAASRPWNAFEDSFGRVISRKIAYWGRMNGSELVVVRLLLENGHDPNEPYRDWLNRPSTPWRAFLNSMGYSYVPSKILPSGIITLLLEYGADPDATPAQDDSPPGDPDEDNGIYTDPVSPIRDGLARSGLS